MKVAVTVAAAFAFFVVASVGLWRTVGGLVNQAGAREAQQIDLDVRFTLVDDGRRAIPDAPVRLLLSGHPTEAPASAGHAFVTDATGVQIFTASATVDKVQKKRPTSFVSSLFSDPELTDHLTVGVELGYLTYRWLYVADFYRFPDGDVVHDGLSLYTRDEDGHFSRQAEPDDGGWKIADLGPMRMTTLGYELMLEKFDQAEGSARGTLAMTFVRQAAPAIR